jgi:hypothetical protein
MQDVNLYKSITNIDPGSKGQGHRRPHKGIKKDQITHNKFPTSPNLRIFGMMVVHDKGYKKP